MAIVETGQPARRFLRIMLINRDLPVTVHHTWALRDQEGTEGLSKTVTGQQAVVVASTLCLLGQTRAQEQGVTAIQL